jgi:putative transposase
VDHFSRVSPVVEVDVSLSGSRVVEALGRAIATHGWPKTLCVDNGPGLSGRVVDQWAHRNKVKLHFSLPGKPGALWAVAMR